MRMMVVAVGMRVVVVVPGVSFSEAAVGANVMVVCK